MDMGEEEQVGLGADRLLDRIALDDLEPKVRQEVGDTAGDVQVGVEIACLRKEGRTVRRKRATRRPAA